MLDPPDYADRIVIPFTLTIPDPRPRARFGRWGRAPAHHPSFNDPGWFSRHYPSAVLAALDRATPLSTPLVVPVPPDLPSASDFDAAVARARRRARQAAGEIGRGEYGAAAGHLLLGQPFPAEVDDPDPTILHTDLADTPRRQPPKGEVELDQAVAEAERDLEARQADSLNERHLQAAEADRRGEPVMGPDGRPFQHEKEVAQSRRGLAKRLDKLLDKLHHEEDHASSEPSEEALERARLMVQKIEEFLGKVDRRLPGLQTRENK